MTDPKSKSIEVTVCTWEPRHTLERLEAQQRAVADGTIAKLIKKYGKGTGELQSALARERLVSMSTSSRGTMCLECGALVETVLAAPGITDKLEAVRDVAQDFDKAIVRTRQARS